MYLWLEIPLSAPLEIYACVPSTALAASLQQRLQRPRYHLTLLPSLADSIERIAQNTETIDCLILELAAELEPVLAKIAAKGPWLPVVLIESAPLPSPQYHAGEVCLHVSHLGNSLASSIDRAVGQFLNLEEAEGRRKPATVDVQQRLASKLRERLGYLRIYCKRDPKQFYRHLSPDDRAELRQDLAASYRRIILGYFAEDTQNNAAIDRLAESAFLADVPVTTIVEIHMELMEEFAQQLRLEGRDEEILLDYRLALIDVIAHLSEMYRRALPSICRS